jgi:hypothetical protein
MQQKANPQSEQWYCTDGLQRHGPMGFNQLKSFIASHADGDRLLVWSPSNSEWVAASSVSELAVAVVRPPPIPTQVAPPIPSTVAAPANLANDSAELTMLLRRPFRTPRLLSVNGTGWTFAGCFEDPSLSPKYHTLHVFVFFFIPLIPLRIFLVEGSNPYKIYGSLSLAEFSRLYPGALKIFVGDTWIRYLIRLGLFFAALFVIVSIISYIVVHSR